MNNIRLVSASAGSGKTYSLTERVLEAVAAEGIAPDRIMAVTFTKKAATELVERIRERLVQPNGEDLKRWKIDPAVLRQRAALLSDAYIGTVNGICGRLLREYAFEAGLSPAIDVLPEEEADRLFRLAIAAEIDAFYPRLIDAARRLHRNGEGNGFQKDPDWKDDVQDLVDMARANGIEAGRLAAMAEDSVTGLLELLGKPQKGVSNDKLLAEIGKALEAIETCEDSTDTTAKAVRTLRAGQRALERGYWTWKHWSDLAAQKAGKRSGADECLEDLRAYAARVQHHPQLHEDVRTLTRGVFECAAKAMQSFDDYKRAHGLMDFVDQESKVLALLDTEAVRARIRERIDVVMVDEFQDTSPIQLALFAKLAEMVDRCVWVGDQKQAIYGFRGADPVLMDEVIGALSKEQVDVLEYSWRSRPGLVGFANAVFERAFEGSIPPERVRLEPKRADADGQALPLAVWQVQGSNKGSRTAALAEAVAGLLEQPEEWQVVDRESGQVRNARAGDVAILCRTHNACADMAEALAELGISASYGSGSLLVQPECAAVLAGLRLLVDPEDSLALAELVQYLPGHASADSWLDELIVDGLEKASASWVNDERIARLMQQKSSVPAASPLELTRMVADVLQVRDAAFSREQPEQALSNLDALERLVRSYEDACKARHEGASLPGLVYWISCQDDPGLPAGQGEDTVQVLTWHASKGLEWPIVILSDLDSKPKYSPFGLSVLPAEHFDTHAPLADRKIRFWPEPVSGGNLPFTARVEASDAYKKARERELGERKRLMYVGMTRARDYLVLVQPCGGRAGPLHWLDDLTPEGSLISLPETAGDDAVVKVDDKPFACRMRLWTGDREEPVNLGNSRNWLAATRQLEPSFPPYAVSPSDFELPENVRASVADVVELGERIELGANVDMAQLGEAVHGFLAADSASDDREVRLQRARDLLQAWEVEKAMRPEDLLAMADRLHGWIRRQWPDATVCREWPMRLKMGEQVAHGWMDMVIESCDGFAIVDHKSYPGDPRDLEERAGKFAGQLFLYRQALAEATGRADVELWLHFALQGCMLRMEIDG